MFKVLIMGLPGSGKTTLAEVLTHKIKNSNKTVIHLNADKIRGAHDDWDFSIQGRLRQAIRMRNYANVADEDYIIIDFVCPLPEMRDIINADYIIWMDTINRSRFEDTNKIFDPPISYDLRIKSFKDSNLTILNNILKRIK